MEMFVMGWLAVCFVALFGYTVGRRVGRKEGRTEALAEAPLRLRMRALQNGACPICDGASTKWYNEREEVIT